MQIGGIEARTNHVLGRDIKLDDLRKEFDAVFLSIGLGDVNDLGLEDNDPEGVYNAVDTIAESVRQKALKSFRWAGE